ncbi:MAG: hypothetical protein KDB53_10670, partial [Planctomycetes bacterium]|nr:hypothetical protein [Planctomycetota bacterium]
NLLRGELLVDRFRTPDQGLDLIEAARASGDLSATDGLYAEAILAPTIPAALALLDQALAIDPAHRLANEMKLSILIGSGQARGCAEHARVLALLYPGDPVATLARAAGLGMRGEDEECAALLSSLEPVLGELQVDFARFVIGALSLAHDFGLVTSRVAFGKLAGPEAQGQMIKLVTKRVLPFLTSLQGARSEGDPNAPIFRVPPVMHRYIVAWQECLGVAKLFAKGTPPTMMQVMMAIRQSSSTWTPEAIDRILALHPEDGFALLLRSLNHQDAGEARKAMLLSAASLQHESFFDLSRFAHTQVLFNANNWLTEQLGAEDRAFIDVQTRPHLEWVAATPALEAQEYMTATLVSRALGHFDLGIAITGRWRDQHPQDHAALLWRATLYEHEGKIVAALGLVEQILAESPEDATALGLKTRFEEKQK